MGLFGSSGTRGVVGEDLTPAFVERLAAVAATYWDAQRVAVASDTRATSEMLVNAASAGIASTGVHVDRLGVIPTPALQDYLETNGIPGCMITASHNPPEYNGVKLFGADGLEMVGNTLQRVERAFDARHRVRAGWDRVGRERTVAEVIDRYVDGIIAAVDSERIIDAELTVVIDPGHGAGIESSARLCRRLGCKVIGINDTIDGSFPGRRPEPAAEALEELTMAVRASEADIGVAHDGDADRAMFVDETGAVVDGHTTLAILAAACVEPGDVVISAVDASQRLADVVADRGGTLERTAIGSARIVERIRERQSARERIPLAGEGNGGIFLPEIRPTRDAALVLARMLELVCEQPLSVRAAAHGEYHLVRRTVSYRSTDERARMLAGIEAFASDVEATLDRTDGIRAAFDDGWVLARPSGTEPVIRIVAEADDPARAERYVSDLLQQISS